jgi:hypothetical protein
MKVWSVGTTEVQLHPFFTSAIAGGVGGEWSPSRPSVFGFEKEPGTHRIGGWVDFRVRVGVLEKEKCLPTSWIRRRQRQQQQQQEQE